MSRTDTERRKFFDYYAKLNRYGDGYKGSLELEDRRIKEKQLNP